MPINDPFLEQTAPVEEAETVAPPKGRPARGKKAAVAPAEQDVKEEVGAVPEPVQSNARSLRARKAQPPPPPPPPPPPNPKVQRNSRTKVDKGKEKAEPVASQNDVVEDFPAQQQEVVEHIVEEAAIPKRRGRLPKVIVAIPVQEHTDIHQQPIEEAVILKRRGRKSKSAAAVEVEEITEVDPHLEEEPITPAKPGRGRRVTKAAEKTPVRRNSRRDQATEPEAEKTQGSRGVAVVIEKVVISKAAREPAIPQVLDEQPTNAETDEEATEEKLPVVKMKATPKRKGGRKPPKGLGKKASKPVEEDLDQETEQVIEAQPDAQLMEQPEEKPEEELEKGTGSSQAEVGSIVVEPSEVSNVSVPVAPEITANAEESPVASAPANNDADDEDNILPLTLSQTPIPAPVMFSPSRTTQSFSEPTKSPTPVPSSPLARFSSPTMKSPIVGSRKRDFDDVTPRSSPINRSRSNPSTPLASSTRTTFFGVELTTPNQLSRESNSYTPSATIKHLDVASSPILHPPRNIDESERPGKSPVKNATPRSSLDPATARNLFGGVESNQWASDSPRRRSSGVSPMKRQSMSFTEFGELKSQAEVDGMANGGGDGDDAGDLTEEDSEFQRDDGKETPGQLTPSKDQEAEGPDFEIGTDAAEKETLQTQADTEDCTSAALLDADDDSELEDNEVMNHQQEDSHAFVGDSTFNNDSLFAIPAEGFSLPPVMFSTCC